MSENVLLSDVVSVLIPENLSLFHLVSVKEYPNYIVFRLEDSPDALKQCKCVVLDDFTNSIELQRFPLNRKPVYFEINRHRWKESGNNQHYSKSYDLHQQRVKPANRKIIQT